MDEERHVDDQSILSEWVRKKKVPSTWTLRKTYQIGWPRAKRLAREIESLIRGSHKKEQAPSERREARKDREKREKREKRERLERLEKLEKLERNQKNGVLSVSVESQVPLTPEDVILRHNLDPDEWDIVKFSARSWDSQHQGRVITLHYSRADLKPRDHIKDVRRVLKKLAQDIKPLKLPKPRFNLHEEGENLLLINISDIHVGKFYENPETGERYDIETAVDLYLSAVSTLLDRARRGDRISRIVHVVGNDILHVDHGNATSRGTPQDTDGHWRKAFEATIDMVKDATLMLREVAPVDILVVPGNHDEEKAVTLGYVIDALFKDDPFVSVSIPYEPRAFYTWGSVLLGFTHGNYENYNMLPGIMALHPDWSATRFHEWHVGHVHHEKEFRFMSTNMRDGVIIHVHPSLTKPDRWHRKKGFVTSLEAAVGYVYHKRLGNTAVYKYYALEPDDS